MHSQIFTYWLISINFPSTAALFFFWHKMVSKPRFRTFCETENCWKALTLTWFILPKACVPGRIECWSDDHQLCCRRQNTSTTIEHASHWHLGTKAANQVDHQSLRKETVGSPCCQSPRPTANVLGCIGYFEIELSIPNFKNTLPPTPQRLGIRWDERNFVFDHIPNTKVFS